MHDVIIVGAGPAGVSCAIWLKQLGFKPILLDKNDRCGGAQLLNPYTNTWIATSSGVWGRDVANAMDANVRSQEIETKFQSTVRNAEIAGDTVRVTTGQGGRIDARFLVLATGSRPRTAGLVARAGLLIGSGAAVASTDFKGARVAILGGGDSAIESYHVASHKGAASVTIFARSVRARASMLEQVDPSQIVVGEYTFAPEKNEINGVRYDQVLVHYGVEAGQESTLGLDLAMRGDGFICTDPNCRTSNHLVYAIGEVAGRAHPCCATAMADGVVAAKDLQRRLEASASARLLGSINRASTLAAKAFLTKVSA